MDIYNFIVDEEPWIVPANDPYFGPYEEYGVEDPRITPVSNSKLGVSTPPIKTPMGWLVFYHGVRQTGSGKLYRVGAMLLDLENPAHLLGYTPHFIFGPEEDYERIGDVPNVIFPCGVIDEPDGTLKLYYGAADTCIALAEVKTDEVVHLCQILPDVIRTGK